jgi:hypothetical protein
MLKIIASACLLAIAAGPAFALKLKAGLWEISTTMKSSDPEVEKAMKQAAEAMRNMPPEQRKMVEEMAKQGVSMGQGPGGATTVKVCFSQSMVDKAELPTQTQGDCKHENEVVNDTTRKVKFSCSNPESRGEGTYIMSSDSAFNSDMNITTKQDGKTTTMQTMSTGTWQASDCGNIKPMG